jgi:hypothetical protein
VAVRIPYLETVEEAMSQVMDRWEDLQPPMKEATSSFASNLGRRTPGGKSDARAIATRILR